MKEFVLDNSIVMSWFFEDESSEQSENILRLLKNNRALVPSLWFYELANVLFISENKRNQSPQDSKRFLKVLSKLPIFIEHYEPFEFIDQIVPLCRKYSITAYDAAYLYLSLTRKIPLATSDKKMMQIAQKMNIECLG